MVAIVGVAYLQTMIGALRRQLNYQSMWFLAGITIVVPILVLAIALNDETFAYVQDLLDQLLFNKLSSGSGVERSSWNRQGFQNLIDTFGFGVGNGSMRTSSFPIAVLGSLGIVGALIMGLFLVSVFFNDRAGKGSDRLDEAYRDAAQYTCIAWLITQSAAGAMVDLGLPFFLFAALACTRSNVSSLPSAYGRIPGIASAADFLVGRQAAPGAITHSATGYGVVAMREPRRFGKYYCIGKPM